MSDQIQVDRLEIPGPLPRKALLAKARWASGWLSLGLVAGAWVGGGPDRFGEEDGFAGGLRGAGRTMARGFHYASATIRDCMAGDRSGVRNIGLTQQIETRLWQDKRLVAGDIIVQVEDGGTALLRGIVPDEEHKERAVSLARETRGVERIIDELAVRPSSRTIDTVPTPPVPTGVASNSRDLR